MSSDIFYVLFHLTSLHTGQTQAGSAQIIEPAGRMKSRELPDLVSVLPFTERELLIGSAAQDRTFGEAFLSLKK